MQRLKFSGAVRLIYRSLGVKGLRIYGAILPPFHMTLFCDVCMRISSAVIF